jgi:DNA topoisomerase-3
LGKTVFIAEKPSVAESFAKALHIKFTRRDGYEEAQNTIVTWCFGHLVTMSYPDAYDEKYKRWSLATIPFIPDTYKYEVINDAGVKKQFKIVKGLLTSPDVDTIYICTDSGREGEYIYRLVANQAGVRDKKQLRVWIDSFTDAEIIRGIKAAKDDSEYDNMGAAAYLRAKEDYLMGINFSRALSLKYARGIRDFLGMDHCVIAVGRVMTCVLGIVVKREREIRAFQKTPFYRVMGSFSPMGEDAGAAPEGAFSAEWSVQAKSRYHESPLLYKDNGFKEKKDAEALISYLEDSSDGDNTAVVHSITHKKETKNPPLLYNLAELQNDCSRFFKISPDETLNAAQALYEAKLTTYPRTDARVLSTAVAKEIDTNLKGIGSLPLYRDLVREIAESGSWKKIAKTKYTNDKAITDHYAIIPTGQGYQNLAKLPTTYQKVYELIVRRFLSVFYPAAIYDRMQLQVAVKTEILSASLRVNKDRGYLKCLEYSFFKKKEQAETAEDKGESGDDEGREEDPSLEEFIRQLKKGDRLQTRGYEIREGETTPPKRYNSGSMILTMENAGQFIENEELREQIKGSGIGTSATRAGILAKLVDNQYLNLNKKTQIYTPTQLGEMIYDAVDVSIRPLLDPKLTASWEKGLTQVAEGTTSEEEYQKKLDDYITRRTNLVKQSDNGALLNQLYRRDAQYYPKPMKFKAKYTYTKYRGGTGAQRKHSASKDS